MGNVLISDLQHYRDVVIQIMRQCQNMSLGKYIINPLAKLGSDLEVVLADREFSSLPVKGPAVVARHF